MLVGFMGTGKTSVGKILGSKLVREVIDVDLYIEKTEKRKIADIFGKEGETHFRMLEKNAVEAISRREGIVITTGGGVVLDPENMKALGKNGVLVALSATPETIFRRVRNSKHRPLLQGGDPMSEIKRLYALRKPLYEKCDFNFPTDNCTPSAVAEKVLEKLKGRLGVESRG